PPDLTVAGALREDDERPVASFRIESAVQHLAHVACPVAARRPDRVVLFKVLEVLELRKREVPCCKRGIRLIDERALDDCEGRDNRRSGRNHGQAANLAYGTASAPVSPLENPPARSAIRSSSSARSPG